SMFTTTPFFRPREGCEPIPTTSIAPSGVISPTIATTLEVPMSKPTNRLRSDFFVIGLCPSREPRPANAARSHLDSADRPQPNGYLPVSTAADKRVRNAALPPRRHLRPIAFRFPRSTPPSRPTAHPASDP